MNNEEKKLCEFLPNQMLLHDNFNLPVKGLQSLHLNSKIDLNFKSRKECELPSKKCIFQPDWTEMQYFFLDLTSQKRKLKAELQQYQYTVGPHY